MRAVLLLLALLAPPAASAAPGPALTYAVKPDLRLCPSAQCGGWWLRAVNRRATDCADGTRDTWCYVAEIDWAAAGWTPQQVTDLGRASAGRWLLVLGRQELRSYGGIDLGALVPVTPLVEYRP